MPFNIALSGLQTASTDLKVVGNNIANGATVGFKRSRLETFDAYMTSALGTSGMTPGAGVRPSAITQQFTQGTIDTTESNLDLAINGEGLFMLSDGGSRIYSRSGMFGVDNNGFIVNSLGHRLQGIQADEQGTINGGLVDLEIITDNLAPSATTEVEAGLNLDSGSVPPVSEWLGTAAFGGLPPDPATYNNTTSSTIYDSLGNAHIMTAYLIKTEEENTWDVRLQIDGQDVYSNLPKATSVDSKPSAFTDSGTMDVISGTDLQLNGTTITTPTADGVSTTDATASALALANAINAQSGTTGVTATTEATTINLGTYTPGALSGSDFEINGVGIVVVGSTQNDLITAINTSAAGVAATVNSDNEIIITRTGAAPNNGANIQIEADGSSNGATFTNFSLLTASDKVQRGTLRLNSNQPIQVGGSSPLKVDISANTYSAPWKIEFDNNGAYKVDTSDVVSVNWTPLDTAGNPIGADAPQLVTFDIATATQYGSNFAVQSLSQDGFATGNLTGVDIDLDGTVFGHFSNGQSQALGQIQLASFRNMQGLQPVGDTAWRETSASGPALVHAAGTENLGNIISGALENSNTDLTAELVDLISSQKNFQANAKTISTADELDQTIINL